MSLNQINIENNAEKEKEEEEEDDDDYDDEELIALKEMKNKLMAEVCELREKLIEEERRHEIELTANFIGLQTENGEIKTNGGKRKEIEFSERLLGVSFDDVSKTLLQDDIYQYKTTLTAQFLKIAVELTVSEKNNKNSEILKIDCHFPDTQLNTCFRKEVEPWINTFTEMKDFSSLLSAFANYVDQSYVRTKILKQLEKRKYVTKNYSTEEEGGFTINVHSPKNVDDIYFTLQWTTRFLKKTCQIEHYFIRHSTVEESSFARKNSEILQEFHRSTLKKSDIEDIWKEIINAIENEK